MKNISFVIRRKKVRRESDPKGPFVRREKEIEPSPNHYKVQELGYEAGTKQYTNIILSTNLKRP
jgi:hypothetical protein